MKLTAAAAAFLIVWAAGLSTLAPACPHGDSGETAGVALHLGIAHPPGYPLPTLLGNLFVRALPVGSVPWRVSLLSLAAAAMAGALLTQAFEVALPLAVLLGVSGGLGLEIWNQMTLPKGSVYTVTIALLGGIVVCLARLRRPCAPAPRRALSIGLALGLAGGGHYLIVLPFVPFLVAAFAVSVGRRGMARMCALGTAGVLLGLSLYLYIPVRAPSAHPMFRWAEPVSWKRFSWLVLRQQYMSIEKQARGESGRLLASRFASRFGVDFGRGGFLLLGLGLAGAVSRRRFWVLAMAAGGSLEIAAAALYPKLETDALWVADPFFSAGWYALVCVMVAGLEFAASFPARWWRAIALAGALALVGRETLEGFSRVSKRWNYYASDQEANLAATLPANALMFSEGDAYIAPLLYGLYVDGRRPDVRMIIPIFLHFDWGLRQLMEEYPDLRLKAAKPWGHIWLMTKDIMEAHPERPWVYTLTTSAGWPFARYALPDGLVYRIGSDQKALMKAVGGRETDLGMFRFRLRDTMSGRLDRDPFGKVAKDNYVQAYFARGAFHSARRENDLALAHFERARRLGSPEAALNAGLQYYATGRLDLAEKCWRQARDLAPGRPESHVNLALIALHSRPARPDEAIMLCERAVALNGSFVKAYEVLASAWYLKGQLPQALASLQRALELRPGDRALAKMLEYLRRGAAGK